MSLSISTPLPVWQRIARRAGSGGRQGSRRRRYLLTAGIAAAAVWGLAGAYLALSPKSYTSAFVYVLPGTGAASQMNLDRIGSATSTAASPFSTPDMSPTENYRKMLLSHRLLTAAAGAAGEAPERFPTPKIELADQTKLITVSVPGRTPEQAQARAESLRQAFAALLDSLRRDEIAVRDRTYQEALGLYQARLQEARQRLIEHQARTGLVSLEQYGTVVTSVESLRERQRDAEQRLAQGRATAAQLAQALGTTPQLASLAMVLRADPQFQALLDTLAKQDAEIAALNGTRGNGNPRLMDAQAERGSVLGRLAARGTELTGLGKADVLKLRDLSLRDERARLFERLVSATAENEALDVLVHRLGAQTAAQQARVVQLADDASRLENLRRDVQVAEAVFSSALARIDTSKADFFASYPMVQLLETPQLPTRPSSPQPMLAVAGGLGATFLITAALVLAWLRLALLRRILKNA